MPHVLLATDAEWIRDDIDAALSDPDTTVSRVRRGSDVVAAIRQVAPDLVILDLQIGNMGGIATCHSIRHEQGANRLDPVKVLLLLDRADDRWLATTSGADGWMVKPLDTFRIRRATRAILAGEAWDENPEPVA